MLWDLQARELFLYDSAILVSLETVNQTLFHDATQEWLPDRISTLVYRGTRDGFTPDAFHAKCDGKGATVTLIQTADGAIFGGYSSVSWVCEEPGTFGGVWLHSPGAFLFTARGPVTTVPVRFPLKMLATNAAVCGWSIRGPIFGGYDIMVQGLGGTSDPFDYTCFSELGTTYEDTLGHGPRCFTPTGGFLPVEIEVFAVAPLPWS